MGAARDATREGADKGDTTSNTRCRIPSTHRVVAYVTLGSWGPSSAVVRTGGGQQVDSGGMADPPAQRLDLALQEQQAAEDALRDLQARVDNAQQLAHMGDYDWEIATDTNTWSDQLFRIYGYEPGAFNPNYEKFISFIRPEDRERIQAIHQAAYA